MKKRDLILAGALLLGFGLNAQAQTADEQLFFFGFEDGLASFQDSSNPIDSITQIKYYDGIISNGTSSYPKDLTIAYVKDSLMLLLNGLSPMRSRGDISEIVSDPLGGHKAEMEAMGAQGGEKYFKYTAGGEFGGDNCPDYNANLFVRGIKFEPFTSYRLVFYTKASSSEAAINAGVFSGYYNSEKPISMNGASGNEFYMEKRDFTTDNWERNTLMMFYQNDSVANRHMYYAGFWWENSWKTTDPETGKEYNAIKQFEKFFYRISFMAPGVTYYLDDIALYKSTIGGAEFNGDILRVNFGYQTNLGDIAKADPAGAVELPGEYFSLTAEYGGDPYDLEVMSAEYHDDGYLYIWLDDDSFDGLENVRLSLKNPTDPALQLKYTGSLYPYSLDTAWVNAGKIVPDFENEFAVYNPDVFAISRLYIAPIMKTTSPEKGSFNLDVNTETVDVTFSKDVYANLTDGTKDDYNVIITMESSKGKEIWTPSAYDPETFTVTFKRPAGLAPLSGDCDFTVMNARAGSGDQYQPSAAETFTLSFGDLSGEGRPQYFYRSEPVWTGDDHASQCIPLGWTAVDSSIGETPQAGTGEKVSSRSRMYYFGAGGAFTRGFYTCPRGTSRDAVINYGTVEGYSLVLEPGDYLLSFKLFGWDGTPTVSAYVYPVGEERPATALGKIKAEPQIANGTAGTGRYVVSQYSEARYPFTVDAKGSYQIEFVTPKSSNWQGAVIGAIELSNQYSEAFKYIQMLEDAQAAAAAQLASAEADPKYSGANLEEFKGVIDEYKDFKHTAPSAYEAATKTIKDATTAMGERMTLVDKYYTEYAAAEAKEAEYTESEFNQLVAYKALVDKIAEYKDLDVTVKDNEALTAITAEVTAATKAMTDRCAAIDKFNSTIENAKKTYDDNEQLQGLDALVALNNAYGQYKDLDRIAVTDEDLTAATDAVQAAIDKANNVVTTYNVETAQLKNLYGLATDLEIELGADVKAAYEANIEDDQNLAKLLKLEINKAIYKMLADAEDIPEGGIDYSGFIQNAGLYMVGTLDDQIERYYYSYASRYSWRIKTDKEYVEDVFPGWSVKTTGSVHAAVGPNGIDGGGYAEPGYAKEGGIAADWSSSYTLKQTVIDLPNGVYTLGVKFGAGEDNITKQHVVANGDTLSVDKGQNAVDNTWENIVVTDNKLDLTAVHTGCNAWSRLDDWSLTLISVDPATDYAAEIAKIDAEIAELMTNVAPVESDADVKFYNLGGIATERPEGISIRVTTGKNGARKVEKVLVK